MTKFYLMLTALFGEIQERSKDQDRGAAMVEYGLLVALIAVVAFGAVTLLGANVKKVFDDAVAALPG